MLSVIFLATGGRSVVNAYPRGLKRNNQMLPTYDREEINRKCLMKVHIKTVAFEFIVEATFS